MFFFLMCLRQWSNEGLNHDSSTIISETRIRRARQISNALPKLRKETYFVRIQKRPANTKKRDLQRPPILRPNKCQKRPTIGAKETYYMLKLRHLLPTPDTPACGAHTRRDTFLTTVVES